MQVFFIYKNIKIIYESIDFIIKKAYNEDIEREVIRMYNDIEKIKDILMYKALEMDSVAHINGDDLTLTIATEESAELIQALTKVKRYGLKDEYKDNLQEEIADVLICISELLSLGYIDISEVEKWHTYKVDREIKRAKKRRKEDRR